MMDVFLWNVREGRDPMFDVLTLWIVIFSLLFGDVSSFTSVMSRKCFEYWSTYFNWVKLLRSNAMTPADIPRPAIEMNQ